MDEAGTRRRGRPYDRSRDADVLAATLDALVAHGYEHVTLDAVALAAGLAKTTLYRRWPTKADLFLAAVAAVGRPPEADALPDEGSLRADLLAVVDSPWLGGPDRRLAVFAGLTAAATRGLLRDGLDWVSLGMWDDNHGARRIYHRLGFATAHRLTTLRRP